jgi:hypothetical protein
MDKNEIFNAVKCSAGLEILSPTKLNTMFRESVVKYWRERIKDRVAQLQAAKSKSAHAPSLPLRPEAKKPVKLRLELSISSDSSLSGELSAPSSLDSASTNYLSGEEDCSELFHFYECSPVFSFAQQESLFHIHLNTPVESRERCREAINSQSTPLYDDIPPPDPKSLFAELSPRSSNASTLPHHIKRCDCSEKIPLQRCRLCRPSYPQSTRHVGWHEN